MEISNHGAILEVNRSFKISLADGLFLVCFENVFKLKEE